MSMGEFEKQNDELDPDSLCFSLHNENFPDDFSDEDVAFAHELESLFSIEHEETPPLYVQTLLAAEDPRYDSLECGFEQKTRAKVFRRLHLKRRLFEPARPSWRSFSREALALSRPFLTFSTACLLFMLSTMVVAGPSFAAGLTQLLSGPHSGVVFVKDYPTNVVVPTATPQTQSHSQTQKVSIHEAQEKLTFPLFFPRYIPTRYSERALYLYEGDQDWTDGPMMVVTYTYRKPGLDPRRITICQFKPNGQAKVLQVVKEGAAKRVEIDTLGTDSAIYVVGSWIPAKGSTRSWVYNNRSELIYEDKKTGTIFWIVGEKQDGIGEQDLASIIKSRYIAEPQHFIGGPKNMVTLSEETTPQLFANDLIYVEDASNMKKASFRLIGRPVDLSHGNLRITE